MKITTTSNDTLKGKDSNDYGVVVIREKEDTTTVIKNYRSVGTYMASDRGLFRQLQKQQKIEVATFAEGIEIAEQWLETLERETNAELLSVADDLRKQAANKNYKNGWVFYRMKDYYGYNLATLHTETS